jgi:DNA polymerase III delta subunit
MASELALLFLRSVARPRELPPALLITGPNRFLREYVLTAVGRIARAQGFKYQSFQVSGDDDLAAVLDDLSTPDLFAPRRLIVCRVMKNAREAEEDGDARRAGGRAKSGGVETGLIDSIAGLNAATTRLAIVYDRDNAPAKLTRAVERHGMVINCMRAFDDQYGQYATVFARLIDYRLTSEAADLLASGFAGDLAGLANAIEKAALGHPSATMLTPSDFACDTSGRAPELFAIAEAIGRADLLATLGMIDRAMAVGRDALELLGVEIVPTLRRMMLAAALLRTGKSRSGVAGALGMAPGSQMAARAVDGARRFGPDRLRCAYEAICELEASIKAGLTSETRDALARILIDLMTDPVRN